MLNVILQFDIPVFSVPHLNVILQFDIPVFSVPHLNIILQLDIPVRLGFGRLGVRSLAATYLKS